MTDGPLSPCDGHDPDDDLLGIDQLLDEGLDADEARAVLGPHTALTRHEVEDRLAMLRRERRDTP
jgi:hypothetical protein